MNEKYGCWISNNIRFHNKYEALLYATQHHQEVKFWYHDEVFQCVDKTQLNKISLNTLYKERAQQLRDSYDYLILYYSGGSDSHNILRTFIDNNIKLDEICVKWPKQLIDGKFYKINSTDTSSDNLWSEWNYCVVPTLDWIRQYHPEIKITIKDYVQHTNESTINQLFETQHNHGFRAGAIKDTLTSDSEEELINKGKTVGNIYGVDKPYLLLNQQKIYMFFSDIALVTASRSIINPNGAECFYWSPDMPLLPYAQAYQLFLYYKINVESQKFLFQSAADSINGLPRVERNFGQQKIAKQIIYSTWDNRFQADKKRDAIGTDLYNWLFSSMELSTQKEILMDNITQRMKLINNDFLNHGGIVNQISINIPKTMIGAFHYIGNLDN